MPSEMNDLLATVARLEGELRTLRTQLSRLAPERESAAPPAQPPVPMPAPAPMPTPVMIQPQAPLPVAPRPSPRPPAPPPGPSLQPATLLAIAGAGLFLLGVIFFLWLSIQRGWISPPLRVLLGLFTAAGLMTGAAKLLSTDRRTIAVALLAAALGTLDFSAFAGFSLYHLYPGTLGFALAVLGAVIGGALAAKHRHQGAFTVGLLAALLAPPFFSTGEHHEVALSLYLAGLMGALLLVPYKTKMGMRWGVVRWLAITGVNILLAAAGAQAQVWDLPLYAVLIGVHLLLAGLWIWLPGLEEAPGSPLTLWAIQVLASASILWEAWERGGFTTAMFALPILAYGALNLALVKPMRTRLGNGRADFGLLALGTAFLALALPIALDWAWVGPLWGCFALALAYAAGKAEDLPGWSADECANLRRLALGLTILASFRWLFALADSPSASDITPFVNQGFALGMTTSAAWLLLARRGGAWGIIGFISAQLLFHPTLAWQVDAVVRRAGGTGRDAAAAVTVALALSGALQWLRGIRTDETGLRRALTIAGYLWLGFASAKLILFDLAQADLAARALAFLAVGGIFLAAALVGAKVRKEKDQ
jgi:hypothetical protein